MCNFLSALVLKNGSVLSHPMIDSHSELVEYFGLPDQTAFISHFAKVELTPVDWLDASTWTFRLDEDTAPAWWDDIKEQAEAEVRTRASAMILKDVERGLIVDGCWIIGGDTTIREIRSGRVMRIWGGTVQAIKGGTVEAIKGGTVRAIWGGTVRAIEGGTVEAIRGGTVWSIWGGTVGAIKGGTVGAIKGGTVGAIKGGTVRAIWGGTVRAIEGGTVEAINTTRLGLSLHLSDQARTILVERGVLKLEAKP